MGALCSGEGGWGVFLHMICRLSVAKSHENGLGLEQLDPLSADLAAWPIAPEDRTRGKREGRWIRDGCIADWWISFGRRRSARPEHRAHASGMDGVRSVFLATLPKRERTARGQTPSIQHTQRPVSLLPSLLRVQGMARGTAQRAIRLESKVCSSKPFRVRGARPLWRPV